MNKTIGEKKYISSAWKSVGRNIYVFQIVYTYYKYEYTDAPVGMESQSKLAHFVGKKINNGSM